MNLGVRSDFDNIDNEALDFEQLEAFIQNNGVVSSPSQNTQIDNSQQINPSTNLPESPPDSGSEPPYSPSIKVNQAIAIDHLTMNTLTELHTPHHHQHHLLNQPDLYLSAEHQQQQLIQINSMLHKHENQILQSHQQEQMLLYQVNQSGQIMELNQMHQQNHSLGNRLYKNDMIELDASVPLPAIHGIQQNLNPTMNENITIIGGNENFQRTLEQLNAEPIGHVKKRKGERGEGTKAYQKELSEEFQVDKFN